MARSAELERCNTIIREEAEKFIASFETFSAAPLIKALSERAHRLREAEVNKVLSQLVDLPAEQKQEIERFSQQLVNKLLHSQITAIKQESQRENAATSLRTLARALGLDVDLPNESKSDEQIPQPEPEKKP